MAETIRTAAAQLARLGDGAAAHSTNREMIRDIVVSVPSMVGVLSVKEPRFGAVGDGVTDDTTAIQAAITAAQTIASTVFIPDGTYKVSSSLLVAPSTGVSIRGAGRGSILVPTAFAGKVISVQTGSAFPENTTVLKDFVIRAAAITVGQIGVGCTTNSFNGVRMERVYAYKMDVGFHLRTAQFCSFIGLSATQCTVGLKVDQDSSAGGGNNNTFLDCWFSYNVVGVFFYGNSIYPMHSNEFINLTTHANTVCAVHVNTASSFAISNWAPEANGTGAASVVVDGVTVQNATLHAEAVSILLQLYGHTTATQAIVANNNSQVTIDGGHSATMRAICDATSWVSYTDTVFKHYSSGVGGKEMYALRPPTFAPSGNQSSFISEPRLLETRSFPNEACGDVGRTQAGGGTSAVTSYVTDPLLGSVLQSTYADGTKTLILPTKDASYTTIGTRVVAMFLAQSSDSAALWNFDFAQSTANISAVPLEAGKWYRVVMTGAMTATPRGARVSISANNAAAFAATLRTARMHAFTVSDPRTTAVAIREGVFNANLQPDGVSADNGDADLTLSHFTSMTTQRFATTLTANRTVTLPTYGSAVQGNPTRAHYRIVRSGLGAFTLNVGGLKTIPSATAAFVDVEYQGVGGGGGTWILAGYGTL